MPRTLAGSRLEGAPIVRTSASSGEGLDDLVATLDAALDTTPGEARPSAAPASPSIRAFTIQGFGAVVTGTLLDGSLEVGQGDRGAARRPARAHPRASSATAGRVERLAPRQRAPPST